MASLRMIASRASADSDSEISIARFGSVVDVDHHLADAARDRAREVRTHVLGEPRSSATRKIGHDGDDAATSTAGALQYVIREHAAQQLGPRQPSRT
jgi:hypothetical protein